MAKVFDDKGAPVNPEQGELFELDDPSASAPGTNIIDSPVREVEPQPVSPAETVSNLNAAPAPANGNHKSRAGRIMAGAAVGAAGLLYALTGGGSDDESVTPDGVTTTQAPTTSTSEGVVTTDGSYSTIIERSDLEKPFPDYMTASSPVGLIAEYDSNMDCMHNESSFALQSECASLIAAKRQGDVYDSLIDELNEVNKYKLAHPDYKRDTKSEIIDFELSGNRAVIVIKRTSERFADDTWRLEFVKQELEVETAKVENETILVWSLIGKVEIDEGNVVVD